MIDFDIGPRKQFTRGDMVRRLVIAGHSVAAAQWAIYELLCEGKLQIVKPGSVDANSDDTILGDTHLLYEWRRRGRPSEAKGDA